MMKTKETKTPFCDALAANEAKHEELRDETDRLLAERGWKWTSNTPGCVWMFEKQLKDGRTLLTDARVAIRIEQNEEIAALPADSDREGA